jgi:hypothetical protein
MLFQLDCVLCVFFDRCPSVTVFPILWAAHTTTVDSYTKFHWDRHIFLLLRLFLGGKLIGVNKDAGHDSLVCWGRSHGGLHAGCPRHGEPAKGATMKSSVSY